MFNAKGAAAAPYTPGEMADSEVLYGSAGRTGIRAPGARTLAAAGDVEGL